MLSEIRLKIRLPKVSISVKRIVLRCWVIRYKKKKEFDKGITRDSLIKHQNMEFCSREMTNESESVTLGSTVENVVENYIVTRNNRKKKLKMCCV